MRLRTLVRDCLFLNWLVPAECLPPPPPPLRYDRRVVSGRDHVFVSALLFRQQGLHLPLLPFARISYPQLNVRTYVIDGDGRPAVLFSRMLVPSWVVLGVRWFGQQPAEVGSFRYPAAGRGSVARESWSVRAKGAGLAVEAEPGPPAVHPGFASWEGLVALLRERPRGFAIVRGGLREVRASHPPVAVVPMRAEIGEDLLLRRAVLGDGTGEWPELHSSWICPEIPFVFELGTLPTVGAVPRAAAPAPI
jgi:Uncharacterized conserved protein (COG2071)